jgi:hypothetical protein
VTLVRVDEQGWSNWPVSLLLSGSSLTILSGTELVPMENGDVEAPGAHRHQEEKGTVWAITDACNSVWGVASDRGRANLNAPASPWEDRGFYTILGLHLCAVGVAIVGVTPRCLVLLLSRMVPTVSVSQGISDFKDLWAPCKNAETAFPAFSPDGIFLRFILVSENFFVYFGLTLAFLGILFGTFPHLIKTRRRKLLLGGFASLDVMLAIGTFTYVALNATADTTIAQLDSIYYARQNFAVLGLFIALVSFVALSSHSRSWGDRVSYAKLSLLVCIVIIFCAQVRQIYSFLHYSVFRGSSEIIGMICLQMVCKGLLLLLRSVVVHIKMVRLPPYCH